MRTTVTQQLLAILVTVAMVTCLLSDLGAQSITTGQARQPYRTPNTANNRTRAVNPGAGTQAVYPNRGYTNQVSGRRAVVQDRSVRPASADVFQAPPLPASSPEAAVPEVQLLAPPAVPASPVVAAPPVVPDPSVAAPPAVAAVPAVPAPAVGTMDMNLSPPAPEALDVPVAPVPADPIPGDSGLMAVPAPSSVESASLSEPSVPVPGLAPAPGDPFLSNPNSQPSQDMSAPVPQAPAGEMNGNMPGDFPPERPSRQNEIPAYSLGTGEPGARALNGPQAPQLTVEKVPPLELLVGKSSVWKTVVRNVGQSVASGVIVRDVVPRGAQLIETLPPAQKGLNGDLIWQVGDLPPGKQAVVSMELVPLDEGRIGSVATVGFQIAASAEGYVAKPQLAVQTLGVRKVGIGNATELTIVLSNPGTGVAKNIVLTESVPPQLQHEAKDSVLTYSVGDLKPDETRSIKLQMTAIRPGKFTNVLVAVAEPSLKAESRFDMEVIAPMLKMSMSGPTRRFLERESVYRIEISNPGTASAKNVGLKVQLPLGLQFVRANNAGVFDKQSRTVQWLLEELPPSDSGEVEMVTMPTQIGPQTIRYQAWGDKGVAVNGQKECMVEGMAALLTQVSDTCDPVLVGEKSTYQVNVTNQGSKASMNVQVSALIPAGIEFLSAEGPSEYRLGPNSTIVFDAIPQLAPKASMNYKILVKGIRPGDQRLKLSVISDELSAPVTKEESTQVYQDQM